MVALLCANHGHEIFVSLRRRHGKGTTHVTTECLSSSVAVGCAAVLVGCNLAAAQLVHDIFGGGVVH